MVDEARVERTLRRNKFALWVSNPDMITDCFGPSFGDTEDMFIQNVMLALTIVIPSALCLAAWKLNTAKVRDITTSDCVLGLNRNIDSGQFSVETETNSGRSILPNFIVSISAFLGGVYAVDAFGVFSQFIQRLLR